MSLSFDDWLSQSFRSQQYHPEDLGGVEPGLFVDYCTRLFSASGPLLEPFSDAEVDEGLNSLVSPCESNDIFALKDESIALEARLGCLHSIFELNRDCFAVRCTRHLSHLDRETPKHVSRINRICYMWWDVFIIYGNRDTPCY
jgi:hypothetical protein